MRRRRTAALVLAVTVLMTSGCIAGGGTPADSRSDPGVDIGRSIVYGEVDGTEMAMDACIPADRDAGPFPAAVLIHGGAFREGSRANMLELCAELASEGVAAFPIDYRLLPASFPAPVDDTVTAVEWLRQPEQVERFDLSDRLSLLGSSAGGIIALTAAQRLAEEGDPVSAVVTLSAAGDLTADALALGDPDPALEEVVLAYLGCDDVVDCPQSADASPRYNLSALPPTLLVHGEKELIPIEQAEALESALEAAGIPVTLVIGRRGAHGLQLLTDDVTDEIVAFLVAGTSP